MESPAGVRRVLCSQPKTQQGDADKGDLYTVRVETDRGTLTLAARMPVNLAAKQREINGYVIEYNRLSLDRKARG